MTKISLKQNDDGRCVSYEKSYKSNHRMGVFTGSWIDETRQEGVNTWSHSGVYCGEQFGRDISMHERRLVFLGMLVAYVNGDKCAHWTDEQRTEALQIAWRHIQENKE
ncbi:MAG: hypothetical protein ACOC8X_11160 [Chloroflexota bacterium]